MDYFKDFFLSDEDFPFSKFISLLILESFHTSVGMKTKQKHIIHVRIPMNVDDPKYSNP